MVVASLKSWDGTRILGVFDTEDAAIKACKLSNINTEVDDFYLDFIEMNKISMCQTILVDDKSHASYFSRMHVYDDKSKNIMKK